MLILHIYRQMFGLYKQTKIILSITINFLAKEHYDFL